MRLNKRWSVLGLGLLCFAVAWAMSAAPEAASGPATESTRMAEPVAGDSPVRAVPDPIFQSHDGCHAKVTCKDGTTRECQGDPGESCSTGSENCVGSTCSGTRNFALCGSQKVTCPCCATCPDPDCPAGNGCVDSDDCGPCGACFNKKCECLM